MMHRDTSRTSHVGCRSVRIAMIHQIICLVWMVALAPAALVLAGNFLGPDPELIEVAEAARRKSAIFWSGMELPGDWNEPCPISAQFSRAPSSGETRFRFVNGEVFDWRMQVSGLRAELLSDVIPHEVDHMVRASLVRRPLVRWLDEGCAALSESELSHARLREQAAQIPAETLTDEWLNQERYPIGAMEIERLYAGGFSLVEFLLTRESPLVLLEMQRATGPMTNRLQQFYQLSPQSLRNEWTVWRRSQRTNDCRTAGCRLHTSCDATAVQPKLTIWTAKWCPACLRFQEDLRTLKEFRETLQASFMLEFVDADRLGAQVRAARIESLPTFVSPKERFSGYPGPEQLLLRLGLKLPEKPPAVVPGETKVSEPLPFIATENEMPKHPETMDSSSPPHKPGGGWGGLVPVALTVLQWTGVIGGTVATGGVGGIASALLWGLIRRRWSLRKQNRPCKDEGSAAQTAAPFPRALDEAGELLAIRQTEGRVAVLDTLRGLFLDDELEKREQSADPQLSEFARQLRTTIDDRVDEVAPLTISM